MRYCFSLLVLALSLSLFAQAAKPAKIIIGGDSDFPPYEFINEAGLPDGYNVELSRSVARMMGMEPEFRLGKWSLVRTWLEDGTIDLVQGMAFSIQRAQEYYFSGAHTVVWQAIFIRKDSNIMSETDLINSSVVIQEGDIAEEYLRYIGFGGELNNVPSPEIALKLLENGDFDACITNYMLGMYLIQNQELKYIKALPQRIQQRDYCFASLDEELIQKIDTALVELESSGELKRIRDKWFAQVNSTQQTGANIILGASLACIPLLILLIIFITLYRRQKQQLAKMGRKMPKLQAELIISTGEIEAWTKSFSYGPVILYKATHQPAKLLFISENIRQWGYTPEEICAEDSDLTRKIFFEDCERVLAESHEIRSDEYSMIYYRALNKAGEPRWVLDYYRILPSPEDGENCYYGYLVDITDQKTIEFQLLEERETARAASIAKSHFLANMNHEIRTTLNGITGFLQVLMQMKSNPQQMEIYDLMYSSSHDLLRIINETLDFPKIESDKMELIINDFNPHYLINDLIRQFEHQVLGEDVIFKAQVPKEIPDLLKGDQFRLRQVLSTLLQNAVKYTKQGQILLSAEVYTRSETDLRILFKISDTGIGIAPKKQNEIFDNSTQGETYLSSKYKGTGLRLAIVKRLVELMQGFIWVENEPGTGSCFFFILPFTIPEDLPKQASEQKNITIPADKSLSGRILLVEDEPVNQMVTKRQLEIWGLSVDIANNGSEALIMYDKEPYDLILMDICMPVMDGINATQQIRDMEINKRRHTPIVAFTAAALAGDRERFLAVGMDEYIAKPVEVNNMYKIISKLIKTKSDGK
ncbi:MAG: transporter substrate-binding domain-containing protein [Candidatus Cloacimonadaceae bacterium]|jgi:signal transduction histidine kinase/ABC-type amino acid transport substrate-binding protein/ActR/RegA family two-component response regulator|nr:transporter substrate-binding domain-containing protein [Candidatus Cloacimonadaceae bacterium]